MKKMLKMPKEEEIHRAYDTLCILGRGFPAPKKGKTGKYYFLVKKTGSKTIEQLKKRDRILN
jgi:hypothetical protein